MVQYKLIFIFIITFIILKLDVGHVSSRNCIEDKKLNNDTLNPLRNTEKYG